MTHIHKENRNSEGYHDPTAYKATKPMTEEEIRVSRLVHAIRELTALSGFEITNRIELRGIRSRRTYR